MVLRGRLIHVGIYDGTLAKKLDKERGREDAEEVG